MSFQVLVTGRINMEPKKKISKNGNPYIFTFLSIPTDADYLSASIFAFDNDTGKQLLALSKGDEVAITGSATLNEWEKDSGEKTYAINITATQVMSIYQMRKKKTAVKKASEPSEDQKDGFNDEINF